MKIITSVYGNDYAGLLVSFLSSVHTTNPDLLVEIFWNNIDIDVIEPIKKFFRNYNFYYLKKIIQGEPIIQKSSKVHFIKYALEVTKDKDRDLLIIDSDTLVLKKLNNIFSESFDIAFTPNRGILNFPINIGVLFLKKSILTIRFVHEWLELIEKIHSDRRNFKELIEKFGAGDQAAFCKLIGYECDHKPLFKDISKLIIKEFDIKKYNNYLPTNDFKKSYILHYKGGWQTLIFNGRSIKKHSYGYSALPKYKRFLKTYIWIASEIKKNQNEFNHGKIGIKIPIYFDTEINIRIFHLKFYNILEKLYRVAVNRRIYLIEKLLNNFLFKKL